MLIPSWDSTLEQMRQKLASANAALTQKRQNLKMMRESRQSSGSEVTKDREISEEFAAAVRSQMAADLEETNAKIVG